MMRRLRTAVDIREATIDPGSVFPDPESVLYHPTLSRRQKIEILRRWRYDARDLTPGDDDGEGDGLLLERIGEALAVLVEKPAR